MLFFQPAVPTLHPKRKKRQKSHVQAGSVSSSFFYLQPGTTADFQAGTQEQDSPVSKNTVADRPSHPGGSELDTLPAVQEQIVRHIRAVRNWTLSLPSRSRSFVTSGQFGIGHSPCRPGADRSSHPGSSELDTLPAVGIGHSQEQIVRHIRAVRNWTLSLPSRSRSFVTSGQFGIQETPPDPPPRHSGADLFRSRSSVASGQFGIDPRPPAIQEQIVRHIRAVRN